MHDILSSSSYHHIIIIINQNHRDPLSKTIESHSFARMLVNLLLLIAFLVVAFAEKSGPALNWQSVASGKYHVAAAAYNNEWDKGYQFTCLMTME